MGLGAFLNSAATSANVGAPALARYLLLMAMTLSPTLILPDAFARRGFPSLSSRSSATSMVPASVAVKIMPA